MPIESSQLDLAVSSGGSKEKIAALNNLVEPYLGIKDKKPPIAKEILKFARFLIDQIGEKDHSTSKPTLTNLTKRLQEIDEDFNEQLEEICIGLVNLIRPKYSYFCDSLINIVRLNAELFQSKDEFKKAGQVMASIETTDDQYVITVMNISERCEWKITTAQYFLEDDDNTSANMHIQKARKLLKDINESNEKYLELDLKLKTCYSRILDAERKFLQAAVNYMELSLISSNMIKDSDLMQSLENAITCAMLTKPGPARERVLGMLYRDERSKDSKNYKILEKMHKNRILSKKDQDDFSKTLSDHHKAALSGGLTVFEKAVYEHNMLSASIIYKNIKISELAQLLGVNDIQAEDLARVMIQEGRMNATIDQIDEIIEFENDSNILLSWDNYIQDLCMNINDIVDSIDMTYPNQFNIP